MSVVLPAPIAPSMQQTSGRSTVGRSNCVESGSSAGLAGGLLLSAAIGGAIAARCFVGVDGNSRAAAGGAAGSVSRVPTHRLAIASAPSVVMTVLTTVEVSGTIA